MNDDYAMVPEREFLQMKKDVDQIKKDPLATYQEKSDLLRAMQDLTKMLSELNNIFQKATDELRLEEKEAETIGKKIDPLFERMDLLIEQNKKIAKGIVAVADMLESKNNTVREEKSQMTQQEPIPPFLQQTFGPSPLATPPTPPPAPVRQLSPPPKRLFNF